MFGEVFKSKLGFTKKPEPERRCDAVELDFDRRLVNVLNGLRELSKNNEGMSPFKLSGFVKDNDPKLISDLAAYCTKHRDFVAEQSSEKVVLTLHNSGYHSVRYSKVDDVAYITIPINS